MNTLVVIGYLGDKRAYLNVSMEEAARRYVAEHGDTHEVKMCVQRAELITFGYEFCVYDAWKKD